MSPAALAAVHDELESARRLLDRCLDRASAMVIMAAFPDPGDEPAVESATAGPRRLPAPPLPRRNLPPED